MNNLDKAVKREFKTRKYNENQYKRSLINVKVCVEAYLEKLVHELSFDSDHHEDNENEEV